MGKNLKQRARLAQNYGAIWSFEESKQNVSCARFPIYSLAWPMTGQFNGREEHMLSLCDYNVRSYNT